jgi:hypothetical protein
MKRLLSLASILLALSAAGFNPARADSREFGDYIVHYSTLPSVMIPAKVAQSYNITRSHYRGLLNIAVLKKQADGPPRAVEARVEGQAENLHEQIKRLDLREVREQDAIYYIAEFAISDGETLRFDVTVTPPGGEPYELDFENVFYVD